MPPRGFPLLPLTQMLAVDLCAQTGISRAAFSAANKDCSSHLVVSGQSRDDPQPVPSHSRRQSASVAGLFAMRAEKAQAGPSSSGSDHVMIQIAPLVVDTTDTYIPAQYDGTSVSLPNRFLPTLDFDLSRNSNVPVLCRTRYVCPYQGCGKIFEKQCKLDRHMVVHTGERRFPCPEPGCGQAFTSDWHLERHRKVHGAREKHFKCDFHGCAAAFELKHQLKRHQKTHEHPFQCAHCPERCPNHRSCSLCCSPCFAH